MKSTERFSDKVDNYVKHRPSYPPEALETLEREAGLGAGCVVADIGSGTGIFSKLLLERGATVYAVEPNAPMRQAAENLLGRNPKFHSIDGNAEHSGLKAASVDLITAAQAFHWFDATKAFAEFRRIAKPGAQVALVWNTRDAEAGGFQKEYEQFLTKFGTDYQTVKHTNTRALLPPAFKRVTARYVQRLDHEGLRGRLLSTSYVPKAGEPRFDEMLEALEDLYARHNRDGIVDMEYVTELYLAPVAAI